MLESLFTEEIGDEVEDGTVAHEEALLERFVADGLGQMCFPGAGRTDEECVGGFADKMAGRQFVDFLAGNA